MGYVLIHHTGCGSSKKGLTLLQENCVEPEIRKYMNKTERLNEQELREIAKKMGGVSPREFMRAKDAEKAGITDASSDDEIFAVMAENPKVIQRPIGINGGKAVVGRPNDALLGIV
ncbi:MAG: ArsC/Spx/MgsR family protein [Xanthomonadales bacterium]|nr:ArsC/Spx/MgsR family protein [Xanthomonadales bacterium]